MKTQLVYLFFCLIFSSHVKLQGFRDFGPGRCLLKCMRRRKVKACFSDGRVYDNRCTARCFNPTVTRLFKCKGVKRCRRKCRRRAEELRSRVVIWPSIPEINDNQGEPVKEAEEPFPSPPIVEPKCEEKCPVYFRFQLYCFSNGELYQDKCRALCDPETNPPVESLFECRYPIDVRACQKRCNHFNTYCLHCLDEKEIPVCGNDGKIYRNSCEAACFPGGHLYILRTAWNPNAERLCKYTFERNVCGMECGGVLRPVCASNNEVYDSKCMAECEDQSVRYECIGNQSDCIKSCLREEV